VTVTAPKTPFGYGREHNCPRSTPVTSRRGWLSIRTLRATVSASTNSLLRRAFRPLLLKFIQFIKRTLSIATVCIDRSSLKVVKHYFKIDVEIIQSFKAIPYRTGTPSPLLSSQTPHIRPQHVHCNKEDLVVGYRLKSFSSISRMHLSVSTAIELVVESELNQ
ncbi:hypothetical protein J6590_084562, partial [Homalodisca vitripennis]